MKNGKGINYKTSAKLKLEEKYTSGVDIIFISKTSYLLSQMIRIQNLISRKLENIEKEIDDHNNQVIEIIIKN